MLDDQTENIVYFIRHGQSEDNVAPVFQSPDSPLSSVGQGQAELVAQRIARISFDALFSSPLPRTRQTTDAITRLTGKIPEYVDLLIERVKPTELSGRSHADEDAKKLNKEWNRSLYEPGFRVGDSENFDDVVARADKVLDFLAHRSEKTIVVVTHGWFLRTMTARVLLGDSFTPENLKHFQTHAVTENTGISVFKYIKKGEIGEWYVWVHNDHAHLG